MRVEPIVNVHVATSEDLFAKLDMLELLDWVLTGMKSAAVAEYENELITELIIRNDIREGELP